MTERSLRYGPDAAHLLDWYSAADPASSPLFVFFHGGGLEGGDRGNGKDPVFTELAGRGISVVSAEYRLYPRAKFPDYIEDAALAVSWCRANLPHSFLTVGGSSAGGYLSMMLAMDGRYLAARGTTSKDRRQIAGYFCDSGQPTVHFNILRERGLDTRLIRVDEAAPVYFAAPPENPVILPLISLIVADNDMPNRPEQNRMMAKALLHMGWPEECVRFTEMKGYGHTGYNYAAAPDGSLVYPPMIEAFVKAAGELAERADS
ncbi:MAG: alpha/beta hydrolase fold domain-containing protein [Clostridia bacterium]|nr:alpha/beta hydrolase fold domain-containing protein [Clostridia bacterium]